MTTEPPPARRRCLEALGLAAVFALSHTQSPLFFSNQNQYLLHGLATAGVGQLRHDWLANTTDPTPLFSWLVSAINSLSGSLGLQAAYFLLLMGYFLSIQSLIQGLPGTPDTLSFRLAFAALFTTAHAALMRVMSVAATGIDYPWYFQAGVAGQYVLGPGLQPSSFGVLLVTGLALFVRGRPILACLVAALPVVFHSTYLLPVGFFTLGVVGSLLLKRQIRVAVAAGSAALLVTVPVVVYTIHHFGPSDATLFREATRILAEVRIPHHCVIARWFDGLAFLQLAWIASGLYVLRRTSLFPVLIVMAGGGLVLTLIQFVLKSPELALMFPWRVSVFLMPVATGILLAKLAARERPDRAVNIISCVVLSLLAVGGIAVMVQHRGYRTNEAEVELFDWVRDRSQEGDVYLLPVRIPEVGSGRGSISTSFTPPPRPKPGSNLIPVDLQRFRLMTGVPIYVDFKAVPYKDVEVLEWFRRMKQCESWYDGDWRKAGVRESLKAEGITHVVTPRNRPLFTSYLALIHSDNAYHVYRVK